jgi:gamma-glutamylcyclotransferase (GGCT)/AIG2-like uncharacterized protein YtfP
VKTKPRHIFVYGTLRSDAGVREAELLTKNARGLGKGTVHARMYDLGEYPGIELSDDERDVVVGELYELPAESAGRVLESLDAYEGIGAADPSPAQYERVPVTVKVGARKRIKAWTYVLKTRASTCRRIPTGDYMAWKSKG